jgi:hypothetical protein
MIDDETRALRSVPVPRRHPDDLADAHLATAPFGAQTWDDAATPVGGTPASEATVAVRPVESDATALPDAPAVEATRAISARRQAQLAAESPVDATTALASVRPVFVDERGRRNRGITFGIYSVVVACVVFLAVVGISVAAGNRGTLMQIPLLGGSSPAEASDTVDTNQIAPPPTPAAGPAPETTKPRAVSTTSAPAPVAVPVPVTTTADPAPTTTVALAPTTTVAPTTTRRLRTTPPDTTPPSPPSTAADGGPAGQTGNQPVPLTP